jgi:hypothetical protein
MAITEEPNSPAGFRGLRGLALESRRAREMPLLIANLKREALEKLNCRANEMPAEKAGDRIGTVSVQS